MKHSIMPTPHFFGLEHIFGSQRATALFIPEFKEIKLFYCVPIRFFHAPEDYITISRAIV